MKRLIFIFIIIIAFSDSIYAQLEVGVSRREFRIKKTGFREAWFHLKEGDKMAKRGKGGLPEALKEYLKAYEYNAENAELNFKVGTTCLQVDKKREAINYLNKAYLANPEILPDIHFLLARAYHQNLEFDNAIKEYDAYLKFLTKKEKKKISPIILKYKQECMDGLELVAKPQRVIIRNLGEEINSEYDDYNSILANHDSLMYFISRRPASDKTKPMELDYKYNEDIYCAKKDSDKWAQAVRWNQKFNNKHHNGVVWVAEDGLTVFLYNGYKHGGDLQYSRYRKNKWTNPKKLRGGFDTDEKETSLTMTADGKEVYFVSSDSRESFGGKDIFYSVKNQKGKWISPKNAGSSINSMYDEDGVFITPDGKTLYFGSKGFNTMGGYDIFKVDKDEKGNWGKPQNLGYPVNSPEDELYYRAIGDGKRAFYSTTRPDTKGGKDIYQIIYLGSEKEMMLLADDQLLSYDYKPYSDIFIRMPETVSIDTTVVLKGIITDSKTNDPLQAKINLIDLERSQVVATTISDATGAYQIPLPKVKNYGIEINAHDYLFLLDVVNMPASITGREINKNFSMAKLEVGAKVILKNIYFETGKAALKDESFAELDKVLKFLQDNNELKIEISGHTDNVGSLKANTSLSEARAKSVVQYLVSRGIPADRLVYKGYAFSQPIAPNNTPEGKQMNRRVEFKILSKE